jgi:hypothetical protein
MVVYTPLLFGLILLGVQLAVWGLAQLAVRHSANHAVQTTRVRNGTVSRDANAATVTVRGQAPQVVPFLRLSVSTRVTAPTERFRAASMSETDASGHEVTA